MNFAVLGINHNTASVEVREKYAFTKTKQVEILSKLKEIDLYSVIVVTCNRTELYFSYENFFDIDKIMRILNISQQDFEKFYFLKDEVAFEHLVNVVCGLDSQIVGEQEIVHQLKIAYEIAKNLKVTNNLINFLFQKSFQISKKVRTATNIQKGNLSYGSIVFNLTENFFPNKEEIEIVILGTGKMAETVAKYFCKEKFKIIFLSTKHYEKAEKLAKKFNAEALRFDFLTDKIKTTDVIITATCSPHCIIKENLFEKQTENKKIIFDLSVPRNVDESIKKFDFIKLYTIDDLDVVREKVYKERLKEVEKAKLNYGEDSIIYKKALEKLEEKQRRSNFVVWYYNYLVMIKN
ncbi:MAG: glutamyl-tRNA reductase, partial [Endomicrobiia bacterium]